MIEPKRAVIEGSLNFKDKEPIVISDAIMSLLVRQDEGFAKPIYTLVVKINTKVIEMFNENSTFVFSIAIEEDLSEERDGSEMTLTRDVVLKCVDFPNVEDHLDSEIDQTGIFTYIFQCFETNHVEIENKEIKSVNYRKTSSKDSIGKILSNYTGAVIDKFCISKIDNNKKYTEIKNADEGLVSSIRKIDLDNGLFKEGPASIFFENKIFYMVNKFKTNKYKIVKDHINDILLFVGSRKDRDRDQYLVQYNLDEEIKVIGLQTGYNIINGASLAQSKYGKKINMFSENHDTLKNINKEEIMSIIDKFLNKKTDLVSKTTKTQDPRMNHAFSYDHLINSVKLNLIKAVFDFSDTVSIFHNYNTQYHTVFTDKVDEKFNGVYVALAREILYTYQTDGSYVCNTRVLCRCVSIDATKDLSKNEKD